MPEIFPIAVLASGSGTTAEALIERTQDDVPELSVKLVVTNNRKAGVLGRVAALNSRYGLDIETQVISSRTHPGAVAASGELTDAESEAIAALLFKRGIGLTVLLGYLKKVSGPLLEEWGALPSHESSFQARMLNTHPGPLPETRGLHGGQVHGYVIEHNLPQSAHTMHVVSPDYDSGVVVARHPLTVEPGMTADQLADRVQEIERRQVPEVVREFMLGQRAYLAAQNRQS